MPKRPRTYNQKYGKKSTPFHEQKADPFYNLPIWKGNPNKPLGSRGGLREAQLMSKPYCEMCKEKGIIADLTGKGKGVVDHITPFRSVAKDKQWAYFTDMNNLQSLCRKCHDSKTGGTR